MALYYTHTSTTAYFAVVTNASPYGTPWDGWPSTDLFGPGDLNVNVANGSQSSNYGIGARPVDNSLPITSTGPDNRNMLTWDSIASEGPNSHGQKSITTAAAEVRLGPQWGWIDNGNIPSQAYFEGAGGAPILGTPPGTLLDSVTASWTQVGTAYNDPNDGYANEVGTQPYGIWVYQVAVPLGDLGLNASGAMVTSVSFGMDCGNDVLTLYPGTAGAQPVPEPVTAIFFATGVVGVLGFAARRRMLHKA
jgi:hypothetical protein